jgi:c-di-GMP-binding flagellar brake protein YcgR
MEKNAQPESRKFKRIRVNLAVVYRVDRPAKARLIVGTKELRATMVDLSEAGISFLTECSIPIGSLLVMKFTLFNLEKDDVSFYGPMEILGEVRYSMLLGASEYRLGILFKRIEAQDKQEISNFLKRVSPA